MRSEPTSVTVAVAADDELVLVERLWQLYRHDLSEFRGMLPEQDGLYKPGRLGALADSAGARIYLVRADGAPAGFALVDGLDDEERTVSEFFVARALRGHGVGRQVALTVLRLHPGRWYVGFQEENPDAARFWRRIAAEVAGDTWSEERVPVPGKPWLPLDVVLRLVVPPSA